MDTVMVVLASHWEESALKVVVAKLKVRVIID